MKFLMISLFVLLISITSLIADESLQPYHWTISYLQYFKMRGYLEHIQINDQPFNKLEITNIIFSKFDRYSSLKHTEKAMLNELKSAFSSPLAITKNDSNFAVFTYGSYCRGICEQPLDNTEKNRDFTFNSKICYNISNRYFLFGNLAAKNTKINEDYNGKTFRGFYAYTEQGYFLYKSNYFDFKIGRDFLKIGPGLHGNLLFSENAGSFDQYYANLKYKGIHFSFFGILLDSQSKLIINKLIGARNDTIEYKSWRDVNRYINGHRISLNINDKFFIGINEVAVYGGYDKNWNWELFNPFIPYMDLNINDHSVDTNTLFSIDFSWYLKNRALIYGEFLIDDYQIEKKVAADLEPNELGFIAGFRYLNLFNLAPSILGFEYTQIRNRTYNAPEFDWEKYLFNNKYIAHELGNNFEKTDLTFDYIIHPKLSTNFHFSYVRKGEEGIRSSFNKSYLSYDIKQGYNEPFPFGIIHSYFLSSLTIDLHLRSNVRAAIFSSFSSHQNYNNQKGVNKKIFSFGIRYWLDFSATKIL